MLSPSGGGRAAWKGAEIRHQPLRQASDQVRRRDVTKHATAGALVFSCFPDRQWKLGLIEHPRLDRWMAPGGHVEDHECQAQAALREIEEEAGLQVTRLLEAPTPGLPSGFPSTHARMPLPWWIIEQQVPADNHLSEPHVHIDHQYVVVVEDPKPACVPAHPFAWYRSDELDELHMFEDTRLLAKALISCIGDLTEGRYVASPLLQPFVAAPS